MVTSLATTAPALVSPGLDLEQSFSQALEGLGLSAQAARMLWLPFPMLLVLVAAVVGVLVLHLNSSSKRPIYSIGSEQIWL